MRIGAVFPQTEIGDDPVAIRDWAQAAEGLGYRHILAYEHVLGFAKDPIQTSVGPMTPDRNAHEPLVLFGYLAGLTRRVELATGILILPQRQTALVAKQAAEVDVLSGGRLRLGIGVGYAPAEFTALGADYHTRGARIEEQMALLRALWTEEAVIFQGRWHHLEGAGMSPRPVQRPIPIWIGGMSEAALKRAAALADGWLSVLRATDDHARGMIERLRAYADAAGRAPGAVGIDVHLPLRSVAQAGWAEHAEAWRKLGATHLSVETMMAGFTSPQQHIDALRRVAEDLGLTGASAH